MMKTHTSLSQLYSSVIYWASCQHTVASVTKQCNLVLASWQ